MLFTIRHSLDYRYERPVFLEPMTVRLTPRQDGSQRLLAHDLKLSETPTGSIPVLEPDGNAVRMLWFSGECQRLQIEVQMRIETLRTNPFDWIHSHGPARRLPVSYPDAETLSLAHCLAPSSTAAQPPVSTAVSLWAAQLAADVDHDSSAFLMHLADAIHRTFHHVGRPEGEPMTPFATLESRTGACRDTAMLFIEACRCQGLAARFVSGYSMHHPPEVSEHELHAWAEVYLPGGGWRGYDPSLGLAVADGHVVLAAAPDHRLAAPLSGSYRGTGVRSTLDYRIVLEAGG